MSKVRLYCKGMYIQVSTKVPKIHVSVIPVCVGYILMILIHMDLCLSVVVQLRL